MCAYSSNVAEVMLCIGRCFQSQHNLRTIKNEMRAMFAKLSLAGRAMALDLSSKASAARNSGARMSFELDFLLLSLYTSHNKSTFLEVSGNNQHCETKNRKWESSLSNTVSSPLGFSDHCAVSVTSSFTLPSPIPPTQRHPSHFENARRADMSNFLLDFPRNDYCFRTRYPNLVATAVDEVKDSGMGAYIPYSSITFFPSNPWFDRACSSAISDREGTHRLYQASPSELPHATFIFARNRCSTKIRRARSSFRKRKIDKLSSSPTEKCFWS